MEGTTQDGGMSISIDPQNNKLIQPLIAPYIHRCTAPNEPMAGNKIATKIDPLMMDYYIDCEICSQPLATTEQLVGHIYEQLLNREVHI